MENEKKEMKIKVRPYFKKSNDHFKYEMYVMEPFKSLMTRGEIWDCIDDGYELIFVEPNADSKNINKIADFKKTESFFLNYLLEYRQKNHHTKPRVSDLNRIIKAGGFIKYITQLEAV